MPLGKSIPTTAIDRTGNVLSGQILAVAGPNGYAGQVTTTDSGVFQLAGVPAGTYEVGIGTRTETVEVLAYDSFTLNAGEETDAALLRAMQGANDGDLLGYSAASGRPVPVSPAGSRLVKLITDISGVRSPQIGTTLTDLLTFTVEPVSGSAPVFIDVLAALDVETAPATTCAVIFSLWETTAGVTPLNGTQGVAVRQLTVGQTLQPELRVSADIGVVGATRTFVVRGQKSANTGVLRLGNGYFSPTEQRRGYRTEVKVHTFGAAEQ